jgi:transglutaminase-like putative cysteine protease
MTIFSVRHITSYRYVRDVDFGEHRLMFRPRDSFDQRLIEASLAIYPEESHVRWIHDVFGNCVALIDISRPASELRFETWITLDHTPQVALDLKVDDQALTYPFSYDKDEIADLTRNDNSAPRCREALLWVGNGSENALVEGLAVRLKGRTVA